MSLTNYTEAFLEMLRVQKNASQKTLESYESDLIQFLITEPDVHNQDCLANYCEHLKGRFQAHSTLARKISAIRGFLKFLYSEDVIKCPPELKVKLRKNSQKVPNCLSEQAMERLINCTKKDSSDSGVRMYSIVEGLYASGMRVSEILSLRRAQVLHMLRHELNSLRIIGKNGTERVIMLHQRSIDAFKMQMEKTQNLKSTWLYPGSDPKKALSRQRINQLMTDYGIKAGIDPAKLSPHVIRHSFATHLLDNKVDLRVIQQLLGHRNISTTQIYTHLAKGKLAKTLRENHPLSEQNKTKN